MPLYEYLCKKCNANFEELVSSSQTKVSCPHCESRQVEKQLSTFGVGAGDPCAGGSCGSPSPGSMCGTGACPCLN